MPLTDDQVSALRAAISFLRYEVGITPGEIMRRSRLSPTDLTNFIVGRSANRAQALHDWAYAYLISSADHIRIPDWIRPTFAAAFPGHPLFGGFELVTQGDANGALFDIFLRHADHTDTTLREFYKIYSGTYSLYRYATKDDVALDPKLTKPDDSAQYVVRSALVIESEERKENFPTFRIRHYSGYLNINYQETRGTIIPIRDRVYWVGQDDVNQYPIMMVARRRFVVQDIMECLLLGNHNWGKIFATKAVLQKRGESGGAYFETESERVGIYRENELIDELGHLPYLLPVPSSGMPNETFL